MKVFLDTNVLLDFYQVRDDFFRPAAIIYDLGFKGEIDLVVSSLSVINANYILRKYYEKSELKTFSDYELYDSKKHANVTDYSNLYCADVPSERITEEYMDNKDAKNERTRLQTEIASKQEILTIKSDDVTGRSKAYEAIVKGESMPTPNIPESLNVLLHELRGLGLSITLD